MAEKFLMPKLSPTMEEGQIARWVKNEGDSYEANETLAEVDTDKATMEMTALTGGTLLKILKQAGDTAALGEAITGRHLEVRPRVVRTQRGAAARRAGQHDQGGNAHHAWALADDHASSRRTRPKMNASRSLPGMARPPCARAGGIASLAHLPGFWP